MTNILTLSADLDIALEMHYDDKAISLLEKIDYLIKRLGLRLAVLTFYNLGKLHGIRQERQRRKHNDH